MNKSVPYWTKLIRTVKKKKVLWLPHTVINYPITVKIIISYPFIIYNVKTNQKTLKLTGYPQLSSLEIPPCFWKVVVSRKHFPDTKSEKSLERVTSKNGNFVTTVISSTTVGAIFVLEIWSKCAISSLDSFSGARERPNNEECKWKYLIVF